MIFKAEDTCKFCANYLKNQTCKAFLTGIPGNIWRGDIFHDHAIDGDNGVLYESRHLHPELTEEDVKRFELD
jgi:hypothetical protein